MNEVLLVSILLGTVMAVILLLALLNRISRDSKGTSKEMHDELRNGRDEARSAARELREEVSSSLKSTTDTYLNMCKMQQAQLEKIEIHLKDIIDSIQGSLVRIRDTLNLRIKELQEGNEKKLDEMRKTVDEEMHDALERRLGESFKLVSERLEAVQKGLGEMRQLATGVGDLKRVLSSVKASGTWAEVQLGAILEQILIPEQYEKNVQVKIDSAERVEYAVRLPGSKDDKNACVWLPIDSKFPQADYLRLQEASEKADFDAVQKAAYNFVRTIQAAAKEIHDKYVNPPITTDFCIMFLCTEGLYAEVLRQPGLSENLQHKYRVIIAGPTTLAAILSSLRMGFQTLAIEQRTSEVWNVLRAIKTEFGKFGDVLDKVKRQLSNASKTLEETGKRSRIMERKLHSVEKLPEAEATEILELSEMNTGVEKENAEMEEEVTGVT
jgi:DNA recombination protein RmuC